ncbi:MAG TPA: sulfite exporter TauE/SafE family protein [Gemmatimonadaceae bacterium]|nr:sulfite exporter TauE/SafE family protein [Gemmatimonadaceae bacterium]
MLPLGFALAALIGVSLGLLGGGGSILTVPVLVYVLGFGAKPAIAMSLPIVGITSLAGTLLHWRLGNVRLRTAIPFALLAMTGAYAGARLAVLMSGATQLVLLAVVMLAAAASMLRGRRAGTSDSATAESPSRLVLLVPAAIAVGLLTGVVGIGGGFLVVPALVLLARVPMRQAVGTSLFVIALNSVAGFAGYLGTVPIDWAFLAGFTTVAIAGAFAGTALVRVVPAATLKRGFGVFLIAVGAFVLYMNRGALAGATSSATGARTSRLAAAR